MARVLRDAGVRGCDFFLSGLQCLEVSVLVLAGGALKVLFRLQPSPRLQIEDPCAGKLQAA